MSSDGHGGFDERSDVAADVDSGGALFAMHQNVQKAAASHFRALFADEARAGGARDETVTHHEGGERAGGATGRGNFRNAVFGGEHARIGALGRWREYEDEDALWIFAFEASIKKIKKMILVKV